MIGSLALSLPIDLYKMGTEQRGTFSVGENGSCLELFQRFTMTNVKIHDKRSMVFFDVQEEDLFVTRNWKEAWMKRAVEREYINLGLKTDLEIKLMRMEIEEGTFRWEEWTA